MYLLITLLILNACKFCFQDHLDAVLTLQFDKKRVITGSADRTARLVSLMLLGIYPGP